jgi:hypothetical protein
MRFAILLSRRVRGLALVASALVLAVTVLPLSASAHWMGWPNGHWQRPGTYALHLNYSRSCASFFWQAAGLAASNWTATNTPVYFDEGAPQCDYNPHEGEVDIYAWNNPNDWAWGYAQAYALGTYTVCDQYIDTIYGSICIHYNTVWFYDPRWDQTYVAGVIGVNDGHALGASQNLLVGTVTHEMGHILGEAHAGCYAGESYFCVDWPNRVYSVMDYLQGNVFTPQGHDVNDVNLLYP